MLETMIRLSSGAGGGRAVGLFLPDDVLDCGCGSDRAEASSRLALKSSDLSRTLSRGEYKLVPLLVSIMDQHRQSSDMQISCIGAILGCGDAAG